MYSKLRNKRYVKICKDMYRSFHAIVKSCPKTKDLLSSYIVFGQMIILHRKNTLTFKELRNMGNFFSWETSIFKVKLDRSS